MTDVAQSLSLEGMDEGEEELRRVRSGGQVSRLPELSPVREEEVDDRPLSPLQVDTAPLSLPSIDNSKRAKSIESLTEKLGLSGLDEQSLAELLRRFKGELMAALDEVRGITTHDDNLERQYKETVAENAKLHSALDKARREIRHLKGQLSVLQMTPAEIREERARKQLRERKRLEQERQVQLQKAPLEEPVPLLSVMERARTVNARGQYIDQQQTKHGKVRAPNNSVPPPPVPASGSKMEPLPPPLSGCGCSECNTRQTLGALTLGPTTELTKSGQQILLGDRVVTKGERLGTVRYIGKLEGDILDHVYIGVQLDLPVGTCDGSLRGRRYFHCPPEHAVFVRPRNITCVTGRKPRSGGTSIPRIRERLPTGVEISRAASRNTKVAVSEEREESPLPSSNATPTPIRAQKQLDMELVALKERGLDELANESVLQMSQRIKALSDKTSRQKQWQATEREDAATPPPRPSAPEPLSPKTISPAPSPPQGDFIH